MAVTKSQGEQGGDAAREAAAVAPMSANRKLEHTEGGVTTRDDASDLGVPMLPGSPDEPQGPEDALGAGPKRGDYTDRIGPSNYHPTQMVQRKDAKPGEPQVELDYQRKYAEEIGDAEGLKGGVDTDDRFRRGARAR